MSSLLELVLWIVGCSVVLSFGEHLAHRWLMHRRNRLHDWFYPLSQFWYRHAVLHHHTYYKVFDYEPDPVGRDVNITLNASNTFAYSLMSAALLSLYSWTGAIVLFALCWLQHICWNLMHTEMHKPERRFFSHWWPYRVLTRYHWIHHVHPGSNFNVVLPFADFIFGTYRRATPIERRLMTDAGF